jgi:molecular chaperone GrpE
MKSKPSPHSGNSGSGQTADPKIILPDGQPASTEPSAAATGKPDPTAEIASLKDQLLRIRADFENSRKRMTREKEESLKYAHQSILSDLLPLLDHLELGLQAAASAKDVASVIAGLKLIQGQFDRFLTEHGVTPIDAVGQPFDPHLHEALGQEPAPGKAEGTVLHQRRRGYKMGDRLLRPASVVTVAPAQPA